MANQLATAHESDIAGMLKAVDIHEKFDDVENAAYATAQDMQLVVVNGGRHAGKKALVRLNNKQPEPNYIVCAAFISSDFSPEADGLGKDSYVFLGMWPERRSHFGLDDIREVYDPGDMKRAAFLGQWGLGGEFNIICDDFSPVYQPFNTGLGDIVRKLEPNDLYPYQTAKLIVYTSPLHRRPLENAVKRGGYIPIHMEPSR